jgi:hypothetical protein
MHPILFCSISISFANPPLAIFMNFELVVEGVRVKFSWIWGWEVVFDRAHGVGISGLTLPEEGETECRGRFLNARGDTRFASSVVFYEKM